MKYIKSTVIIIFIAVMLVPVIFMNTEPNVASQIDNRMLAENPFDTEIKNGRDFDRFSAEFDNYINDRIGFRDGMIYANAVLNDRLFHKMDHPTYDYGKDGYVFFRYENPVQFSDYHMAFADMVQAMQDYCTARNVPFLLVFDPEKKSVYSEYMAEGVEFNNDWVREFLDELDRRGINYIDNTPLLIEKKEQGEQVFNKQYNAGHWNDLGAFYGVNNMLENLKQYFPGIRLNKMDDYNIGYELQKSLQISMFPIHEEDIEFSLKPDVELSVLTRKYDDYTRRNEHFPGFAYVINNERLQQGSPRTMVFQGSYINGMGYKFLETSLGEYIALDNYQNVLDLPYYFNLFQPECVVFEVAEYVFEPYYFDYDGMLNLHWNPSLSAYIQSYTDCELQYLPADELSVNRGKVFTDIEWRANQVYDYVWLAAADMQFDFELSDSEQYTYRISVPNEYIDRNMYLIAAPETGSPDIFSLKLK